MSMMEIEIESDRSRDYYGHSVLNSVSAEAVYDPSQPSSSTRISGDNKLHVQLCTSREIEEAGADFYPGTRKRSIVQGTWTSEVFQLSAQELMSELEQDHGFPQSWDAVSTRLSRAPLRFGDFDGHSAPFRDQNKTISGIVQAASLVAREGQSLMLVHIDQKVTFPQQEYEILDTIETLVKEEAIESRSGDINNNYVWILTEWCNVVNSIEGEKFPPIFLEAACEIIRSSSLDDSRKAFIQSQLKETYLDSTPQGKAQRELDARHAAHEYEILDLIEGLVKQEAVASRSGGEGHIYVWIMADWCKVLDSIEGENLPIFMEAACKIVRNSSLEDSSKALIENKLKKDYFDRTSERQAQRELAARQAQDQN